jgi:hypothetical protein
MFLVIFRGDPQTEKLSSTKVNQDGNPGIKTIFKETQYSIFNQFPCWSIRINAKRISYALEYRAGWYWQLVFYNQAIDDDDISFDDAYDFTAVNQGSSTSGSGC